MRAMVIYSDGRTARLGGNPSGDSRDDARAALNGADPVQVETHGIIPWAMWVAQQSLDPGDPKWMRNLPASLIPPQYGGRAVLTFGPVALTPLVHIDATSAGVPTADEWDHLDELVDDIARAIHCLPIDGAHEPVWPHAIRLAAAVLGAQPRERVLQPVEG